jgi:hypothetical protein
MVNSSPAGNWNNTHLQSATPRFFLTVVAPSARTFPHCEPFIAKSKSPTTFAKRQREQDKRRKASDKLAKRARRKEDNERQRNQGNPPLDPPHDQP